ncbi:PREDICTED: NADH dehydrogenase [ubiquinone] 1 beta subcomplex subunit 4 [Polistes dominula]|uniref:NADH dehydrogenase [ubiquinone] 1 beta subcomplex subunit 4 n=1 Tax=Polistes dominula TaxID=743375 RepID=A0ABM1JD92_POLDO|nr:PREDICTED: NADH dehydrogenase [ubiquinone] 1 beta subcomplex subunit 4 [Polistes dominula]
MSGNKVYDISPEDREVKEWRNARRLELRNEYLRELQDPRRVEPILDRGWQRFYATRVQLEYIFKPTLYNSLLMYAVVGGLIWGSAIVLKNSRESKEKLYRTGQISYQDRMFKFQ